MTNKPHRRPAWAAFLLIIAAFCIPGCLAASDEGTDEATTTPEDIGESRGEIVINAVAPGGVSQIQQLTQLVMTVPGGGTIDQLVLELTNKCATVGQTGCSTTVNHFYPSWMFLGGYTALCVGGSCGNVPKDVARPLDNSAGGIITLTDAAPKAWVIIAFPPKVFAAGDQLNVNMSMQGMTGQKDAVGVRLWQPPTVKTTDKCSKSKTTPAGATYPNGVVAQVGAAPFWWLTCATSTGSVIQVGQAPTCMVLIPFGKGNYCAAWRQSTREEMKLTDYRYIEQ